MTDNQYRCLVAHSCYWNYDLERSMREVGITDSLESVIEQLSEAGWEYDPESGRINYEE